jgi:hypothetical protein
LGRTPLILAAKEGHVTTVKVLLDHGADPGLKNETGETALELTASESIRCLLLEASASLRPLHGFMELEDFIELEDKFLGLVDSEVSDDDDDGDADVEALGV